jgi:hypothetical protein
MGAIRKDLTEEALRGAVLESVSKAQVLRALGFTVSGSAYVALDNKIEKYDIDTSHFLGQSWQTGRGSASKIPTQEILVENSTYASTNSLKQRLLKEGLLEPFCHELDCGLRFWLDKPIVLHLDHINGNNRDNRIENLRLLCPNCHSQTETYCRRQVRELAPVV